MVFSADLEEIAHGAPVGSGADGAPVVEEGGDAATGRPRSWNQIEQTVEDAAAEALYAGKVENPAFEVVGARHVGRRRAISGGNDKKRMQDDNRRIWRLPSHG